MVNHPSEAWVCSTGGAWPVFAAAGVRIRTSEAFYKNAVCIDKSKHSLHIFLSFSLSLSLSLSLSFSLSRPRALCWSNIVPLSSVWRWFKLANFSFLLLDCFIIKFSALYYCFLILFQCRTSAAMNYVFLMFENVNKLCVRNRINAGPPCFEFLVNTFLHHCIEDVERHFLWDVHKKFKGKIGEMCHRSCSLA